MMFELIIGVGLGYFLGRFASALAAPKLDRLLVWDNSIFAWRIVPEGSRLDVTRKYLAATEVYFNEDHDPSTSGSQNSW